MNNQLTFDELRAYQAGRLSGPAQHRVERLLLEEPFYADALAGLEAMQQTARPTSEQLAGLRSALEERIHESATQKRLWPLWIATTTAAILFMLAMAIYFIFFAPKQQPVKPKPVEKAQTTLRSISPYLASSTRDSLMIFVSELGQTELQVFRQYVNNHATAYFHGPLSVRVRTYADGSVRRVDIENGVLVQELGQKRCYRRYKPDSELRNEAERLARQYPHWPKKRQWILWVTGFPVSSVNRQASTRSNYQLL